MSQRKIFLIVVLALLKNVICFSQEFVQVLDQTVTVNSTTSISGYTRNTISAILPEKTIGYIYRISISPKGSNGQANDALFNLLKSYSPSSILFGISLAQFAVKNSNNTAVDAFIFDNTFDADDFYTKKDNNWGACKSMPNLVNCCYTTKECIGKNIFFGFRNKNISQGLDVKLEIVALVDNSRKNSYSYSYTIQNTTQQELKYFISSDNINWQEQTLRSGYKQTFTFEQSEIFFKIYTDNRIFVQYKITPENRYEIIWNNNKWDLVHF